MSAPWSRKNSFVNMSGHSKWSQIKHKKASADAKRALLFSKLGKYITIAVRENGADPNANSGLREAIERARSFNMPSESIRRAIEKASGVEGKKLGAFLFETYGPGGVAILIAGITDNINRTSSETKHKLQEYNCKLAEPGSVTWAFDYLDGKWEPKQNTAIDLGVDSQKSLTTLMDALMDSDDVQNIYINKKE